MDKVKILKKILEISKVLTSDESKKAIAILKYEVSALNSAIANDKKRDCLDLPLPKEIKGESSRVALFTDGACRGNPGPGSWAYIVQDATGNITRSDAKHEVYTTNNKMELKAIIFGLESILHDLSKKNSAIEIWVYTDSKYAVDGMKSWVSGWKKRGWKKADNKAPENLDLWQRLDELNTHAEIIFNWIKGHAGHPQNEFVDQMANRALDENGF